MLIKKHLTNLSLISLILLMALSLPSQVSAQDDDVNDDESITAPATSTPVLLDESDSDTVTETEESED